ncbi:hypothetical protein [Methanobacterium lacus]|nr:hypothetical protein [Methanobacterium lacus]
MQRFLHFIFNPIIAIIEATKIMVDIAITSIPTSPKLNPLKNTHFIASSP